MIKKSYDEAISLGRPPNIRKLFPNSKALIVSGKIINEALKKKGKSACVAINGRNIFIIKGALKAAQRAKSALIIEIAQSEGGINAYCAINYWNITRIVDFLCNSMKISIPVAIHADHYNIKTINDIKRASIEITTLFDAGMTSIAVDASHLNDAYNLLTSIKLNKFIPKWSGLETEVGEIKGNLELSTQEEALYLIRGLNAYNIFPDWIAINNGSIHGIEPENQGINIELTSKIHKSLLEYNVSGAQHGTSGNDSYILKKITSKTRTTKANIATALQMISWGIKVNSSGNAVIDENQKLVKLKNHGVTEKLWSEMVEYANNKKWNISNYKRLNLPFENKLLAQPKKIKYRICKDVEDFVYHYMINIFNSESTAELALDSIFESRNYVPKINTKRIEDPKEWTHEKIMERMSILHYKQK